MTESITTALATAALVGALALGSSTAYAGGGTATHCQLVADTVQDAVSSCWFFANSEQDPQRQQRIARECEKGTRGGRDLIQWCNRNINRCAENKVSWNITIDWTLTFRTEWNIRCTFS